MTEQQKLYRRREWYAFRERCLKRAGYCCAHCNRGQQVVTLQVHHPHYGEDLAPWEYEEEFCEVLCKGCHAREHGIIKPDSGWILLHSDWETGEPSGDTRCEHCNSPMRWHNDLWHPDWGSITVGYDCAEKLGNPEVGVLKGQYARKETFTRSPRWRTTSRGWRYKQDGRDVFIFNKATHYTLRIDNKWGKLQYPTVLAAKEKAFEVLMQREKMGRAGPEDFHLG